MRRRSERPPNPVPLTAPERMNVGAMVFVGAAITALVLTQSGGDSAPSPPLRR